MSQTLATWLLIAAIVLAIIEIVTTDLFFIMLAIGAGAGAAVAYAGGSMTTSLLCTALVSLALIAFVRPPLWNRLSKKRDNSDIGISRLVDKRVIVRDPISPSAPGTVEIAGDMTIWSARSGVFLDRGEIGVVTAVDGAYLMVRPELEDRRTDQT